MDGHFVWNKLGRYIELGGFGLGVSRGLGGRPYPPLGVWFLVLFVARFGPRSFLFYFILG